MLTLLSITFEYNNTVYQALIRCKHAGGVDEFQATIMNGDLEARLYGNHIFRWRERQLYPAKECPQPEVKVLQEAVEKGLQRHLEESHWEYLETAGV